MKGYYIRKWVIPKKKQNLKIMKMYSEKMIRNYIEVNF